MMESDMNTELVVVMASLGFHDGETYFKGSDCLASLKDLIRFLRKEDETCNIRRQMGHARLLQKDLMPMLISHGDDVELTDIVMRLLVYLTAPADICFNKKPEEAEEAVGKQKVSNSYQARYMEVVGYLQAYKEAFTEKKVLAAIAAQLGRILQMEWEDRGEDELMLFERILLLIRNILHVPSSPEDEKRTDDDASLHDQILWNMHSNGIDDLMIYISSSPDENQWVMHAIEIIQLMLREQNPEKLARTSERRSSNEKNEDTKALLLAREKENALKNASKKKNVHDRHPRFGGTFWVTNMKGVGQQNTLVHHKHVASADDISFDHKKFKARVPKRRQEAKETNIERSSTLNIRLFLKEFCSKFLEHSYNPLMRIVKDNVVAKRAQENDDSYFLWCLRFFMAFNRCHAFKVEFVSETLNMDAFHYILRQINAYYDNFIMNKRGGWEPWQKRLHLSIQAYKELLTHISFMDKSNDDILKDVASMIKNNVFYHEEYRSIFLVLLRHFENNKQSKKYLADLVDTFHVFLKLLELFCGSKGSLLVKTKKKVAKRRKKKTAVASVMTSEQLEELWENDIAPELSSVMQGHTPLPEDVASPFDVTSDIPVDEQRTNAMIQIQDHLREGRCPDGVALLRASRECWPDEERFGTENTSPENEFMIVRNLLFLELERPAFEAVNEEGEEEEEENEEEIQSVRSVEREFHLQQFIRSLVSPHILSPYNMLLKSYETNSIFTNHAIVKMFHRVAIDQKFPEMLFQLSLFMTFSKVLKIETSQFKELATFAKYILSKFVECATTNPDIYVDLLFWKGTGDCYQISNRENEDKSSSAKSREKWTFEDEEELKTLYDQYKDEEDVVGEILIRVTDKNRSRQQITNKLVRLKVVENRRQLPKPKKQKSSDWTEEQTEELHRIFDECKMTDDPVGNILTALSFNKSKQAVIKQLLTTGKVSDRKELRKKRKKKGREFKDLVNGRGELNSDSSSSSSSDESDGEKEQNHNVEQGESTDSETAFKKFTQSQRKSDAESEEEDGNLSFGELVANIKSNGYTQQIIWLQTRLRRAAENREEDSDWYPIPLLTMTEEDENALADKAFKKLLKLVGLKPPADHQESFWRIPVELKPERLRKFADDCDKTGDATKGGINAESSKSNETDGKSNKSASTKRKKKQLSKAILTSDDSGDEKLVIEENGDNGSKKREKKKTKKKKIQRNTHDAESESGDNSEKRKEKQNQLLSNHDSESDSDSEEKKNIKPKKRSLVFSDSESESESHVVNGTAVENEEEEGERKKSFILSDSESDDDAEKVEKKSTVKKGRKRMLSLSNSEDEEDKSKLKKKKAKRIINEVSSEDEEETQDIDDGIPLQNLLRNTQSLAADLDVKFGDDRDKSAPGSKDKNARSSSNDLDDANLDLEQSALNFSLRLSEEEDVNR